MARRERTGSSQFAAMLLHIVGQQISAVTAFAIYDRISAATGGIPAPAGGRGLAQGGATWRRFDHETQVHGLATPGGRVSSTGIGGFTLGGGIGLLLRKYGLACDSRRSRSRVRARNAKRQPGSLRAGLA